jgi:outer membrane lipopolysaccharide assembly protein LptE/RlpB
LRFGALILCFVALSGCGYHVAGHTDARPDALSDALSDKIQTIAIPAFTNNTTQYKIADAITAAVTHEMIERAHYRVVANPSDADAILKGGVATFTSYPITLDPNTGRASSIAVIVHLRISLTERASGKVLFTRPDFQISERYEISVDPKTYFDESPGAVDRLSRDVARSVVSGIIERF